MFLEIVLENLMLWLLLVPLGLIFALIIYAFIVRMIKQAKYYKKTPLQDSYDPEQILLFLSAYGGKENILSVTKEMTRVNVEVKDEALVLGENLKTLGAKGVLIQGKQIKCSFSDKSDEVYNLLQAGIKNE